uniref:Uncharacterized protein n=1 Tax=Panagrolaimus sp. ES5 TaxID=591445 RepID=A0AC34FV83_9BILA
MLGVYSRYCRFFLDDDEMKKEYFQKVIQFYQTGEDVKVWFFDAKEILVDSNLISFYDISIKDIVEHEIFKILTNFETIKSDYEKKIAVLESLEIVEVWFMNDDLNFMKTFDTNIFLPKISEKSIEENAIEIAELLAEDDDKNANDECQIKWNNSNIKNNQTFAFRENLLHFISQNYGIRQKLYQCCKYFYAKFQTPLCFHLSVIESDKTEIEFKKSSAVFHVSHSKDYFTSLIDGLRGNRIKTVLNLG